MPSQASLTRTTVDITELGFDADDVATLVAHSVSPSSTACSSHS
jgi:hypothetical protein